MRHYYMKYTFPNIYLTLKSLISQALPSIF